MEVFLGLIIFWGVLGAVVAGIANSKGRAPLGWFIYGFLLFPVALIHILLSGPSQRAVDQQAVMAGNLKCPHCAEWIKREARVCRFCGRDVEPSAAAAPARGDKSREPATDYSG